MPASAGRVRMPHNNRMSTSATLKSSAIWQKTIGHDPYANDAEKEDETSSNPKADAEKVKNLMEMARSQNVTDGANRDDFTAKLYLGLKRGKQRRANMTAQSASGQMDPNLQGLLEDPSSSSEEEFETEVAVKQKESVSSKRKKDRKKRAKKRKKRDYSSSSSDDDGEDESSSDESSRRERRRQRREKRKRKKKRRKHSRDAYDASDDSDRDRNRRRRKDKEQRRDDRKRSRQDEERAK